MRILNIINKHKYAERSLDESTEDSIKTESLGHQRQWINWAMNFKACANLSEQGTGKTKMALDWLTLKKCSMVLVICRNSNMLKWAREVRKHSDYKPFLLRGQRRERQEILRQARNCREPTVAIINYEYVGPFLPGLSQVGWDAIVCDESTAIKSSRTKRHKAIIKLSKRVRYRLILTGTPILNSPEDAYGQFRFLNPNLFGTNHQGFRNRYIVFGGWSGYQITAYKNLEELSTKVARYSFRVLKEDCLDLPPKTFDPTEIEPVGEFAKGYKRLVNEALLEIEDQLLDNTLAITKLTRCLQYCAGFLYTDSATVSYVENKTPKYQELVDFMTDHFKSKKKLIIWAYHRATFILLHQQLQAQFPELDIKIGDSSLSINNRQQLIDWFNESHIKSSRCRCVILQTTSYMHGIDLSCDTAYYYQRSFSLEEWLQSQDRIHGINRGGGEKTLYVVSTILDTVEKSIDVALKSKKSLSDLILRDQVDLGALMRGEI